MTSPIDGYWRGYYQMITPGSPKSHFKIQFVSEGESTFTGQMHEMIVVGTVVNGQIDGSSVQFKKRTRSDIPASTFEGTINDDGALTGKCKIGKANGTFSGTWHAERYEPSGVERFFDVQRRIGVMLLLVAATTFYFGLLEPFMLLQAGEKHIAMNSQFVLIMAACLVVGTFEIIFGWRGNQYLREQLFEKKSILSWILVIATFALGSGLYHLLLHYGETLGYHLE